MLALFTTILTKIKGEMIMINNSPYTSILSHKADELAIQYLPAVKAMSFRLKERLPSSVDYADLAAIGTEELLKLARRYDVNQNSSFWGYAKTRVYGSMLDFLRSLDIMSRNTRRLVKLIEKEVMNYLDKHNEEPSNEYLSDILKEPLNKIKEARIASEIYAVMPLDEQLTHGDQESTVEIVERENLISIIKDILYTFKKKEQMVIQLYYFEELSLKEISEILNITESRISQIHKAVLIKIKTNLKVKCG
jgi:RNA polymerase sigma factor for flagellar operon FliA